MQYTIAKALAYFAIFLKFAHPLCSAAKVAVRPLTVKDRLQELQAFWHVAKITPATNKIRTGWGGV